MLIDEFDFELPDEYIAQFPTGERDKSKLLVLHYKNGKIIHAHFYDIVNFLGKSDVLVINNTKVLKARILCNRVDTGGKIEFLLTEVLSDKEFYALAKPGRKASPGKVFSCGGGKVQVTEYLEGKRKLKILSGENVFDFFYNYGKIPLPPYIKREATREDENRYQTVYAEAEGSIAAPTAGLHFTERVINNLLDKGITIVRITLHVGLGTFRPVKVQNVESHKMDSEFYEISKESANTIEKAFNEKRRIISTGTTSTRALESWAFQENKRSGYTDLFIYPGYKFKVISGMLTNFHIPKSTPLLLVSALCGKDKLFSAYAEAIKRKYRFFSYGDSMLVIP